MLFRKTAGQRFSWGFLIGKGGETLRSMEVSSTATIKIDQSSKARTDVRTWTCRTNNVEQKFDKLIRKVKHAANLSMSGTCQRVSSLCEVQCESVWAEFKPGDGLQHGAHHWVGAGRVESNCWDCRDWSDCRDCRCKLAKYWRYMKNI